MNVLSGILAFLKLTPLEPIATELEKDLADGKISAVEGLDLVQVVAVKAASLFPRDARYFALAVEIAVAVEKFLKSAPATPPAPAA